MAIATMAAPAWSTPAGLASEVREGPGAHVLFVHVPFAGDVERMGASGAHEALHSVVHETLVAALRELGHRSEVLAWGPDDFLAWSSLGSVVEAHTERVARDIEADLRVALQRAGLGAEVVARVDELRVTGAPLRASAQKNLDRAFARVLMTAQQEAIDPVSYGRSHDTALMREALEEEAFTFHYQPIVDTHKGTALSYEALCRGTRTDLRFPDVIFEKAERCNMLWPLSRVLRSLVGRSLDQWPSSAQSNLLFINVHPRDLDDPQFLYQCSAGELAPHASRIVIELTERAAIRDYGNVKDCFNALREMGFRLAIDDLGSGYAGLGALAELEPDFIKFDMGLVRDLHEHPVKQHLIRRMTQYATEVGALVIAEGVEIIEECEALLDAGVRYMQGYYFARPAAVPPNGDAHWHQRSALRAQAS